MTKKTKSSETTIDVNLESQKKTASAGFTMMSDMDTTATEVPTEAPSKEPTEAPSEVPTIKPTNTTTSPTTSPSTTTPDTATTTPAPKVTLPPYDTPGTTDYTLKQSCGVRYNLKKMVEACNGDSSKLKEAYNRVLWHVGRIVSCGDSSHTTHMGRFQADGQQPSKLITELKKVFNIK